jgi:thiosulfate dehydrogenase
LSPQQAWDVAAFMDSHPRPQDPRYNGDLTRTIARYHAHRAIDDYGKTMDGLRLGAPGTLAEWAKTHP